MDFVFRSQARSIFGGGSCHRLLETYVFDMSKRLSPLHEGAAEGIRAVRQLYYIEGPRGLTPVAEESHV